MYSHTAIAFKAASISNYILRNPPAGNVLGIIKGRGLLIKGNIGDLVRMHEAPIANRRLCKLSQAPNLFVLLRSSASKRMHKGMYQNHLLALGGALYLGSY